MTLVSKNKFISIDLTIRELSHIIEMALIVGLYMLTIGTFLGGVWANESWGRYWGWDPKETWALVTILVYAFIAHMRMVPGLRGLFGFNLAALLGFSSVIMTYFGVNYYLSGLHSYAKGDPLPVPTFVYYTLSLIFLLAFLAYINYKKLNRDQVTIPDLES
jgi:cytochrome c biogenesis factor